MNFSTKKKGKYQRGGIMKYEFWARKGQSDFFEKIGYCTNRLQANKIIKQYTGWGRDVKVLTTYPDMTQCLSLYKGGYYESEV